MTEREQTDHLLRQAHHYVITEGENDSPATYIDCIQRIDRALLQEIVEQGYDCDPKLYRRVRQKVDHVQRELEDAVDADSSIFGYEELPECYTAMAGGPLYRMDFSTVAPGFSSARRTARLRAKDEVERTHFCRGPTSQPGHWYKSCPASLESPETVCMADWESLWTRYDLVATGNQDDTDRVTSIGVDLQGRIITHHDNLTQYDSDSRFEVPTIEGSDMVKGNEISTMSELQKVVDATNQGDSIEKMSGKYKYAPKLFLDRLHVARQNQTAIIDDIRSAVNTTPSRPHLSTGDSGNIGCASLASRVLLNKQPQALPPDLNKGVTAHIMEIDHHDDLPVTSKLSHRSRPRINTTTPKPSSRSACARSPTIRRIKAATETLIGSSPPPQCPPDYLGTTPNKVATYVLIPAKKICGRRPKDPTPETKSAEDQAISAGTKRKRLCEDATCNPVIVEKENTEVEDVKMVPTKRKYIATTYERCVSVKDFRGRT